MAHLSAETGLIFGVDMPVSREKWKWFGNAGHFCAWRSCRFHLCTQVGKYIVSSVGDYHPRGSEDRLEEIGCGRLFETMVFKAGEPCECGCGQPEATGSELDMLGYNTVKDATDGHMKLCTKWSRK